MPDMRSKIDTADPLATGQAERTKPENDPLDNHARGGSPPGSGTYLVLGNPAIGFGSGSAWHVLIQGSQRSAS
jgi:hypothetical protein